MGNFKIVSPDQKKFKRVDAPGYTSGDILRLKVGANAGYKKYEEYLKRIQNEEYLTSDDLKGYEDAINSYTSKMDELRAYSQSMGHQFDDNEAWTQAKNSLTSQYKATRDYYSAFSDESQYKKALEDSKRYSYLQGLDLTALTAEIEGYRAEVEDHNDWLDDNVWALFTAGERNKRLERIKELNEIISTKQKEYNEAKNIQDWITLSTINDTNFDNYVNIGKNSKNSLQLPIYSVGSNIKAETDRLKILAEQTTEEERNKYYYYVGKGKTEKAERYLSMLEDEARKRAGSDIATSVKNAGKLASTFYSVVVGLDSFTSGMADVTNLLRGKDANKISPIQYAGSEIREGLNGGWGIAYDVGQSIGNMLPSIALSVATGGAAIGTVAMGASAAGNAYSEMLKNGYSVNQSRVYGVLVGASEAALQYAIGGISPLGSAKGGVLSKATQTALSKVDKALARFAIEWGSSMASEAIEEGVQSILEPIFMSIATGEDINIDWEEVAYSALLGALTSGALEGAPTIAGTVHSNYKTNVQMGGLSNKGAVSAFFKGSENGTKGFKGVTEAYKSGKQAVNENTKAYVKTSLAIDPNNAHAQRMQSRLDNGKSVSGYQLNRLAEANSSALSSKMKSTVEARLTELGEKGNVSKLADAIVKAQTGEKLTTSEKALFKKSEFAEQVLNEGFDENTPTQREATAGQAESTSVTENSPTKENATEGKISASVKATNTDGKTVDSEIQSVNVEGDKAFFTLSNGDKVESDSVDFYNDDVKLVANAAIEKVSRVQGFSNEAATAMIKGYDGKISSGHYILAFGEAFEMGVSGESSSNLIAIINSGVNERVAYAAYELGRSSQNTSKSLKSDSNSDIIKEKGDESKNERKDTDSIRVRNGGKRDGGKNTERQVSRMEGGTGEDKSRGKTTRVADSEATRLVNEGREVKVSDLGILGGSNEQTVRLVDKANETTSMQKARQRAEKRGLKVTFFVGDNLVIKDKSGEWISVRGYIYGKHVFVRADHPFYTADQLARHEIGHDMIANGEVDIKAVRDRLIEKVGKDDIDAVAKHYADAYTGSGMSAEAIWEECICDSLGDMNIFSVKKDVGDFMALIMPRIKAAANESKSPTQTRGSPEAKASREIGQYSEEDYNNYGWVRANDVLNAGYWKNFTENFAQAFENLQKYPRAKSGEFMIAVYDFYSESEVADVVVFAKGTIDSPNVTKIIKFNLDSESEIYLKRRNLYEAERRGLRSPSGELLDIYYKADYSGGLSKQRDRSQSFKNNSRLGTKRSRSEIKANPITKLNVSEDENTITYTYSNGETFTENLGKASRELDSLGNELSKEQKEYFNDSKVRDDNGNLLVVYHGTPKENGDFYVFDYNQSKRKGGFGLASAGRGFYFTTKKEAAEIYTRSGGKLLSVYVNIKNPYIVNSDIKEQISTDFGIDPSNVYLQEVRRILSSNGYDGILQGKGDALTVVAYYPEQIKLTSNKNPTSNPDVRYSRELDFINFINNNTDGEEQKPLTNSEMRKALDEKIDSSKLIALADRQYDTYGGEVSRNKMRYAFLHAMNTMLEGTAEASDRAYEEVVHIADELVYNPKIEGGVVDDLNEMKRHIRSIKFKVQDKDKADFDSYGGYGEFRKNHMGKLTLTNDGISVDSVYMDLQNIYGTSWFPDINTVSEQLMRIAEVVDTPIESIIEEQNYDYDLEEESRQTALDIYTEICEIIAAGKRKTITISKGTSRYLLANALDTAAQNDIEREKLSQYRKKIELINSEEQKLQDLRAQIKELSFKKGPRDTEAINKLQLEANQTANRINIYDRQLLNLESTKALKGVLEREKVLARKKAEEKGKEALARARERAAKTQRELMDRYQESRKKATEGRHKTAERVAIKALKEKFIRMLSSPTDRQYVPESLVKAMVEVCQLIDTDTPLYKKDGSINKAQQARNEQIQKLLALRDEYANLAKHPDPMYKGEFDEEILQYLDELRTEYSGKPIADMTLVELKELRLTLRSIDETLRDARKLIGWGEAELVYDAGDRIIQEQQKITRDRKGKGESATKAALIDNTLSPLRNVDRMSGYDANSPLNKAMREIELGNRKKNKFGMDAHKSFDEVISGKNVKKYEEAIYLPHGKEYIDKEGRKFRISKMQKMQAIMSYDRELANSKLHHVSKGGFTFADLGLLVKGKLSDAVDSKNAHSIMLGAEIAEEFRRELANDTWAQEYMKVAEEFFDVTAKNAINETNMTLKHRIIATGSKYIPYEVNKDFIVREINSENDIQQTISGYGMLKDLQEGASQPIIITGLNNVLERHIDQVSNIVGLAVPIRNFNKIWNVKASDGSTTVQEAIGRNWGNRGKQVITQAVKDVQGSRISHTPAIYKKIKSNVVGATFMLNGSVVMKQTGSLFSATAKMRWRNPVSMLANLVYTMANHKKIAKEVDAYTASAWMRRQGMSESELSDFMTEAKKRGIARLMSKLPAVINPTKWVMGKDYVVALSLWKYAKQDVAKKTGLEGEALLKATAEYYDDIIEHTQSMSDSLHRPEIQKSDNILSETFGMFKTDLYQGAGLLLDAAGAFKAHPSKENAKALAKAVTANLMSALWASMITSAFALLRYKVNRYRDDEDDELTAESWIEEQGAALASDLVGYIVPLFGSELTDIIMSVINDEPIETFDSFTLDAINNIVTAINRDDYTGIITTVCSMFGVPAANIKRVIEAVKLHAEDFANGELFEFEAGLTEPNSTRLYNAYIENDPDKIEKASRLYDDEKDIEAALRKALRENDPRIQSIITALLKRDYKTSKTLSSEFLQEGHFDRELIEGAIEAEFNYVEDKIKEIRKLIESGKTEEIEGLYKKLKDRGYDLELIKKLI